MPEKWLADEFSHQTVKYDNHLKSIPIFILAGLCELVVFIIFGFD